MLPAALEMPLATMGTWGHLSPDICLQGGFAGQLN